MRSLPKHVVFITSTNLACNPRCLKEVRFLYNSGVKITIAAFNLHNWTDETEAILRAEFQNAEFHYLEITRANLFHWVYATVMNKGGGLLFRFFRTNLLFAALSENKKTWPLLLWAQKWAGSPDLVIAHNPPAFYPARILAKRNNIPFALDIEDFHPGEGFKLQEPSSSRLLMQNLIQKTLYTSFASPLIKKYSEEFLPQQMTQNNIVIDNLFSVSEFPEPIDLSVPEKPIRLVWFSQFIDYGRGLEKILLVLDNFSGVFELTLIGNLREHFYNNEVKQRKYIHCLPVMPQEKLHALLHLYDVGLAIEDRDTDINRNICLTNKLWSYFQAGIYIIASDTDAQKEFISIFKAHGLATPLSTAHLTDTFSATAAGITAIRSSRMQRYRNAKQYCWENEVEKLLPFFNRVWEKNGGELV